MLNLWIELRCRMHQDMISVAAGKYSWQKRSGSFIRKINFSKNFDYTVCGLLATEHARCHKEYYSPRGQAVSTSHFPCKRSANFASASDFAILEALNDLEMTHVHEISASETCHGCTHANLGAIQTFHATYGSNWGFAYAKL